MAGPAKGLTPAQMAAGSVTPAAPLDLPPDPIYENAIGALGKTRDNTISGLGTQRTGQLAAFGYSEDPTSHALSFDPHNAFSKASLLKQTYDINRAKTSQSMGSTGQLYAGASQNAQDFLNRGQLQSEDALQKSLNAWLAQNTTDVATAGTTYETGVAGEDSARVGRLTSGTNPLYSPTAALAKALSTPPAAAAAPVKLTPPQAQAKSAGTSAAAAARHAHALAVAKAKKKK